MELDKQPIYLNTTDGKDALIKDLINQLNRRNQKIVNLSLELQQVSKRI